MILSRHTFVKVTPGNHAYWREKGYDVPKVGGKGGKNGVHRIKVKVDHLTDKSCVNVCIKCEKCGKKEIQRWARLRHETCIKCHKKPSGRIYQLKDDDHLIPPREELLKFASIGRGAIVAMAEHYESTVIVVKRWLKRRNIEIDASHVAIPVDFEEWYKKETPSKLEIEKKYNISRPQVNRWLKKLHFTNGQGKPKRKMFLSKEEIQNLHVNEKKTFKEISKLTGVSDSHISVVCKKYDIENIKHYAPSAAEEDIRKFLSENGVPFIKTKKILDGLELDMYNEDHKIAIEYCGLYWHREESLGKAYHLQKMKECNKKDITLLTIFEDEWLERQDIVKSIVLSKLGIFKRKINARSCNIIFNDPKINDFFAKNHLQGRPHSIKESCALYFNNEMVGGMSFGFHHRGRNEIVLNRLAFAKNTAVMGGSTRLFKNCLERLPRPIVTWHDRRWSDGKVYHNLKFTEATILAPDYSYFKRQKRKSKQSMKKSATGCPENITEKEWCKTNGWERIYDCGKIKWVLY